MRTQKSLLFLVFFSLFSSTILPVKASQYGLAKLRYEEFIYLENDVDKVIKVEPNDIGHIRMSRHLQSNNFPPEDISSVASEEFTTAKISIAEAHSLIGSSSSLPSSVNNSLLPSFPPIGDQGQLGSCVAWGSTYYQASHEIGLLNGYNNKTSFTHVLSPKWMYDLIDGGEDEGSSVSFAYQVLSVNGAASILSFPYNNNYTAWDLNTQDWIAAMSNRLSSYSLIPGLNGNLTAIKQALNNGHVLTFATFIDSWQFTIIKRDPLNLNNLHVGEYACTYMNGQNGGHFMTIVGYDDTLWIDINGNGRVDSGERGAFLIANSWGSNWGNHGFIWIAYDAFLSQSAVIHGPSVGRVPAGIYLNNSVIMVSPKAANYTPSLVAEFALTQHTRNQITAQIGASSTSQNRPTSLITILGNQGGALEFNGSAPSSRLETVTFAADLTDLLPSDSTTNRYYLSVGDSTTGNPTTLYSFALIDTIHNRQVRNSFQPKSYDNTSGLVYIDYAFRAIGSAPPTIAFTTPSEAAVLTDCADKSLCIF